MLGQRRTAILGATLLAVSGCSAPAPVDLPPVPLGPYPQIPTGGGTTLASANLVTVTFADDPRSDELVAFVDWLVQSDWLVRVAGEYGARAVEHRAHVSATAMAPAMLADTDVGALFASWLADGTLPAALPSDAPFLYVLIFPEGTAITALFGSTCRPNPGTGYHDMLDPPRPRVPYVVVPTCQPRFSAILSKAQAMELDIARLVVDALTDTSPRNEPGYALTDGSNPWTSLGAEVGDFCWGRLLPEGSPYRLQRVWSNAEAIAGREPCVPAPPGSVPFGLSATPAATQKIDVGVPLEFMVTGWSRAPVADWTIQAPPWVGDFPITSELDRSTLNDGQTARLRVTLPYATPRGTYGAVLVQAFGATDSPAWPVAFTVR